MFKPSSKTLVVPCGSSQYLEDSVGYKKVDDLDVLGHSVSSDCGVRREWEWIFPNSGEGFWLLVVLESTQG